MPRIIRMPPNAPPLARELYRLMIEKGFSAASLSKAAGVGETYIRDILFDRSKSPLAAKLQKIADALECDLTDLTSKLADVSSSEVDPRLRSFIQPSNLLPLLPREVALVKMFRTIVSDNDRDRVIDFMAALMPPGRR